MNCGQFRLVPAIAHPAASTCSREPSAGHLHLMKARRVASIAGLTVALMLTACTNTAHNPVVPSLPTDASPASPTAEATVSGVLMTAHGRGLIVIGHGPVTGTVLVAGARRQTVPVTDAGHGFRLALAPGTYLLNAQIKDGICVARSITITTTAPVTANLSCDDGISTD
jgi:hypothetical protein